MRYGRTVGASFALFVIAGLPVQAATETILYSFPSNGYPYGRLETGGTGALYGTAATLDGYGAAYRLKQHNGAWIYKTLVDFGGEQGTYPFAGLIRDQVTGVFYGTTQSGGADDLGTVYMLTSAARSWKGTVLHSFSGYPEGYNIYAPLFKDRTTGNLFGTTLFGGIYGYGTAFELSESNGSWTFRTIHAFPASGSDGTFPDTQLHPGPRAGTLVGATEGGPGTLFELKEKRGVWSDSVIYSFTGGNDGSVPMDIDGSGDGTIYGVTLQGGIYGHGVVFQLTPMRKRWKYSVIYNFQGAKDGDQGAGINFDAGTGRLYGTTTLGGKRNHGTVFELANNGGTWKETVLHRFQGGSDGASPGTRPIVDRITGVLYGTTVEGGRFKGGTVYAVQP